MKTPEKSLYRHHTNFIIRTPLLPLQPHTKGVEELFTFSKQSFFKEAIYLASPVLYDELVKWHTGELEDPKKIDKLVISLYKYYTRMQSRCTPYGLFAGCGVGEWGEVNGIRLDPYPRRHTRLDMNYLCALAQQLNKHEAILPRLTWYPNNSLYPFGGQLRYVEYNYVNGKRIHQLSSVIRSEYLQLLLDKATHGLSIQELCNLLVSDEITYQEAEAFVTELIESQLLVSELEPAVTGDEFTYQVVATLKKINTPVNNEIQAIIQLLEDTEAKLKGIDKEIGKPAAAYKTIYHQLQTLETPIEENYLFQTDLYTHPIYASLNNEVKTSLTEVINFLNHINPVYENENLKKFKENFYTRYEDAEVPLLEALDTETGIGYTGSDKEGVNFLLQDLIPNSAQTESTGIFWNKQQDLLHQKMIEAIKNNRYTVQFTDEDAKKVNTPSTALPYTLPILFKIVNSKNKIYLQNCGGSSAANLLGRFAHGHSGIHNIIKDITTYEQNLYPDKLFAEIVHLPESRIGNILLRPVLRNYEIPYLGKSALPEEQQIHPQDLFISVRGNKVILRSKKLNKEIIPRLSTAHNYSFNALPVYQFLCHLQTQYIEKPSIEFHWGSLSNSYEFLPRAEYKNVVLAKARWQLDKNNFEIFLKDGIENYPEKIQEWREQWNLPDLVELADDDNKLLIDFKNEISIKMLVNAVKKKERIVLEEFLFDPENPVVSDEKGNSYTNEFIAILLKNEIEEKTTAVPNVIKNAQNPLNVAVQRQFAMGSEWLYYKFYCGIKTGDRLLVEAIKPLVEELIARNLIRKFFFIRYADPDLHIRVRFLLNDTNAVGELVKLVSQYTTPFLEQGLISKIQTDTYARELERYGANSIEAAESFFHIDSLTTLELLDTIEGEEGEEIRWQFALRSVDELLDNFRYALPDKLGLLESLKTGFTEEHGGQKELKQQLSIKFRKHRQAIENILDRRLDATREIAPLINLLAHKAEQMKSVAQTIWELQRTGQLQVHLNDLLASYVHMLLNRIFKARQRTHEMVIYDFLYNYYKSAAAMEKNKQRKMPDAGLTMVG